MPKSTRARKIKRSRSSYKCTCWRFCRAPPDGKVVSKTTYHSHKEQRELEKGVRLEDLENRRSRQKSTNTIPDIPAAEGQEDAEISSNITSRVHREGNNTSFNETGSLSVTFDGGSHVFDSGDTAGDADDHGVDLDGEGNGQGSSNSRDGGEDRSGTSDDEENDLSYGEDDSTRLEAARYNQFVETNVDGIQEMIQFIESYDFEEEKNQWTEEQWQQFLNPPQEVLDLSDPQLRLSIQFYLILSHCSEETYARMREAYGQAHPETPLLSYDQVRRRLQAITGIFPLRIDKCKNNCLAFYGPYSHHTTCPHCDEERFDENEKPRSQFTVIPIGPQLQAVWRHPDSAAALSSRLQRTEQVVQERYSATGIQGYSDIIHGTDYLDLVEKGEINENSILLLYSEDTAQLYRDKESSTLFGIAISGDLDPDVRHLENSVVPLFVVGGPSAAQHDSFVLPTLAHMAACQRRGIRVWDSLSDTALIKYPFLLFALADTVAMAYMSKSVGHHGRNGCRLLCEMPGRHKPNVGMYYPALLRPDGRIPPSSAHPDIPVDSVITPTVESYRQRLSFVQGSQSLTQYKKRRKETGIRGPSLFSALPLSIPCPKLFPADLMHLVYNLGQLMLQLFRGTIDYNGPDDPATWDFAILSDPDDFSAFGAAVERAGRFIPTAVEERAPRNPAEKINSGYKASEYHTLIFGLCVGFFYKRLPDHLYENFCQLVSAIRIIHQRHKSNQDLREAQQNFAEFVVLFECYYYKRKLDRLHFVRPCIHALLHIVQELERVGSLTELSQWTMERTIGNYERRIRLQADPYGNLNREIIEQAMTNALFAMDPSFRPPSKTKDSLAIDVGSGYVSLHPRGTHFMEVPIATAFREFCTENGWCFERASDVDIPQVNRFARLRLPNGQIARSRWQEEKREVDKVRRARNVKISLVGQIRYAEVLYYFNVIKENTRFTLAVITTFSPPNAEILQKSFKTLKVCSEGDSVTIIDAKWIIEVVGMIPFQQPGLAWDNKEEADQYFVLEKLYSNVVVHAEDDEEEI